MKKTFREKISIRIIGSKTLAKVEVPPGSLSRPKFTKVQARLKGKTFPTSAWSFPSQSGFLIPGEVVRELGLKDGQLVQVQLSITKAKKTKTRTKLKRGSQKKTSPIKKPPDKKKPTRSKS